MVGNEQVVKRGTVQSLLALLLTFAGVASVFAQPSFSPASPPTLLPDQRIERAQYWFSRRGLEFGVPTDAYGTAVTDMRAIDASQAGAAAPLVTPTWNFIGPQPMLNAMPNFGGPFSGAMFTATGRITTIAADPTTSGRLFVGAANGGVWMSTNGGTTFTSIGDALPTQAIGALALDPVNTSPPTIYVATGEGNGACIDCYYGQGIFKSSDLGATWTPLSPGTFDKAAFARLAIDTSHNPPSLFAAAGSGVSAGRADPLFFASDPTKNGLWRSTNGGSSWTQYPAATFCGLNPNPNTTPCPAEDVRIDPQNPSDVYVAIEFDNVFISHDGGNTFTPACFTNNTPCSFPSGLNQMDRQSLAVGPPTTGAPSACSGGTKPCGTLYAMIGAPNSTYIGFFKSIDGGATWIAESVPSWPNPNGTTIDGTSSSNFSQEFYDPTLLVSPTNPATVFFGGVGIYQSTDSGAHWTFLAQNGGTHSDQHALALDADQDTVYLGNDGGAFAFRISGISGGIATFTSLNATLSTSQIQVIGPHPTSNTTVLAGFQDNGTNLYMGSPSWDQVETGDGGFTLFDHSNPSFAYHTFAAGGTSVSVGVSGDGGKTWTPFFLNFTGFDPGFAFYPPLAGDPAVAKRVLLGGHHVWVLNFATGAVTQQSSQDLTGGCTSGSCALQDLEFAPSDHTRAWALSIQSGSTPFKLFNTTQAYLDSGATWTDVTGNLGFNTASTQATGIALDPHNVNKAYLSISGFTAATGVGHIFKTTNFGAAGSWTRADGAGGTSPLPDVPVLRVLVDRLDSTGNTLYAATDIGVFKSADSGGTWSAFNLAVIPAVPVFDIEQNDNGVIYVGTHGRGAYQLLP